MKGVSTILSLTIFIYICLQSACSGQEYFFRLDSAIIKDQNFEKKSLDRTALKFIPIPSLLANNTNYEKFFRNLRIFHGHKVERLLKNQDTTSCEYKFALLYYYLAKEKIQLANDLYPKLCPDFFSSYQDLIYADIQLDLEVQKGNFDYKKQLEIYQELFDKYMSNELIKKIIKSRVKQLRYRYIRP